MRALDLIERHPRISILSMRFLWGLRIALPVAVGMSQVRWPLFLMLDVLSALVWAPLVAGAGYLLGAALAAHIVELHRYEHWGMGLVAAAAAIGHILARRWRYTGKSR